MLHRPNVGAGNHCFAAGFNRYDVAVEVIAANAALKMQGFRIRNTGGVPGLYSIGGAVWNYISASEVVEQTLALATRPVIQIKRIGANDMTGIYADRW